MAGEEQTGLIIPPVAIIKIARDHDKIDFLVDCLGHEVVEGPSRGRTIRSDGPARMRTLRAPSMGYRGECPQCE